jgi:hypothetical protein
LPTQTQPALLFYANFGQKLNLAFALLNGAQLFARRQFRDVEILCDVAPGAIFNKKNITIAAWMMGAPHLISGAR